MGITKFLSSVAFIFVFVTSIKAQEANLSIGKENLKASSESLFLHCNSATFVSGETLYYKLYCLNPLTHTSSEISKVAYVELINKDQEKIFSQKLFLENGVSQSDFLLSNTIPTGNYKLIAYTQWMQNSVKNNLFEQDISIINPYETTLQNEVNFKQPNSNQNNTTNKLITLSNNVFSKREKVNLKLDLFGLDKKKGNYSLSVRKIDDLLNLEPKTAETVLLEKQKTLISLDNKTILPELRGELIYGTIASVKSNVSVANKSVALSIPGKSFVFKIVQTNGQGEFIFNIDKPYTNDQMIIQVLDNNAKDYKISVQDKQLIDYKALSFPNGIRLSDEFRDKIEKRSVASQIESAYSFTNTDSITDRKITAFYDPLAKVYALDDYKRFSTLKETITEVVSELNFTKKNGKYYFYLKDYYADSQLSEPSLVILDGLLVQDVSEIINYKAATIDKIEIIPSGYIYGGKVFNGIVSIISKSDAEAINYDGTNYFTKEIKTPKVSKTYYNQNYSNAIKSERIPNYNYQLLWLPNVESNEVHFYTSDIIGTFEIVLEGFTENGKPISSKEYLEVK